MKKTTILLLIMSFTFFVFTQKKIVFDEQFDNNNFKWGIKNYKSYTSTMNNGLYHFNRTSEKGSSYITKKIFIDTKENFYIETKYKQVSGVVNHGFGITFGYSDIDNFYTFIASTNGYIRVAKYEKDVYEEIIKWKKLSKNTLKMGEFQTLGIRQINGKWKFYVNGEMVSEIKQRAFYGSELGFITSNKMSISIDYITVKQETNDMNIIKNAINGYKSVNLGKNVNTEFSDRAPVISADGKVMYYTQSENPNNTGGKKHTDIYFTTKDKNGKWTKRQNIGFPLNNKTHNFVISVSADNNSLIVSGKYNSDGSANGVGMSISNKTKNGWSIPKTIEIENYYNDGKYGSYYFSSDKNILILSVTRKDSYGKEDLYVCFKDGEKYSKPLNLGADVNTFAGDFTPFLAADNKTLYFASYGRRGYGSSDVYVTRRLDDSWTKWSKPKNLGPEINTKGWDAYLSVTASGEAAYLVSTINSLGDLDIFTITLPKSARPEPIVLITGKVLDKETNNPLATEIYYYDLSNGKLISTAISDPTTGKYNLTLPAGKKYSFLAMKDKYFPISQNLNVLKIKKYKEINKNLYIAPIKKNAIIRLNNIFFESGKSRLQPESYAEIDRLVKMLKLNSSMKIEIQGHTDDRGGDAANMALSKKRAKSVYNYLIKIKKIKSSRITYNGYGEKKPVTTKKTATARALNRRVEFKIISK